MRSLLVVALLLCFSPTAFAWNAGGHMVSASIAYDVLKQDDAAALARVLELLRQHPQYAEHFAPKLDAMPADARDRYLLMLAARWPDDVRRNKQYHHGSWHYVNFPYSPGGQEVRPTPTQNILTAYAENLAIARGEGSPADKAVALCWLFHLVGDVHQPLHTVALFTPDYPEGDRGGNLAFVRVREGGQILNLHSLWDGLIIGSPRFTDVRNEAMKLRLQKDLAREKLPELKEKRFKRWAEAESVELAKRVVYRGGKVTGSPVRDAAPVLPEGYTDEAKAVAERQMVLAGYRLADVLHTTAVNSGGP